MNELWLKSEEVEELTGWSARTLQRKAERGDLEWRAVNGRQANGRRSREYLADSLPIQIKMELLKRGVLPKADTSTAVIGPQNHSLAKLMVFGGDIAQLKTPRIVLPDPDAQSQAERRLDALMPLIEYSQLSTAAERRIWCLQHAITANNADDLAAQIAAREKSTRSSIWRWLKAYRAGGFAALADRVRADKGQSRWFNRHRAAAILAAHLYLNERQSIVFVCEQIERLAQQLSIEAGDLPSRETVRGFLSREISPSMRALAREGQREYRERMAPYLSRGFDDVWANQIWVGDHMIHDVEVANDLFDDAPFGAPVRLRLSAMLDYRSRKLVGATWAWEGSSRAIAATMRRGILQFGPPEQIYVDNGKDYLKVAKGARKGSEPFLTESKLAPDNWWQTEFDAIERTGFLARLGIAVTHCIPRHPQSKHVERFFRTLHSRFDAIHSTYTSGSPATRPDQTEVAMMQHRRLFKQGRVTESKHPLASRFILGCLSWIEEYNERPHSGKGMDGRSPNEVFAAHLNPNQKPSPEPAALALLMAEHERRKVRECAITLRKYRYTPRAEDRLAWAAMHEANEREILIAYDPADLICAAALDLDGRFLAWLEAEELMRFAPNDPETQQKISASMEIRRGLEKAAKTTLKAIAAAAHAKGVQSAEDIVYEHLQLPQAVGAAGQIITQRRSRPSSSAKPARPLTPMEVAAEILSED